MGFLGYLLMGGVVYTAGFFINLKRLAKGRAAGEEYSLTHPVILGYLAACFGVMLIVSALIGRFILAHEGMDWAFIVVNSLVATFVFYFGLNPDTSKMNLPN
ncbi:hypothetical protein B0181_04890 [Moraxella caviae]|uniref:Uncharacterized protein n=1 Tax=Moraxella caviae TaxID=34060 RepID=A0A1T0A392_9GAMM|nr:hypothetical protein [Moraxella caviae]OOR90213.1 hypothetical protein B0181_04890 [Moraxella caviae]STZ14568.1 Uncharacterised protein [Moraxella caviae]VEW12573.1 Uncharacterised protein [Moraxella caviae]